MKITALVVLATLLGATTLPAFADPQGRGRDKSKNERGHPDNGNGKNRGRGNAYGVTKKDDRKGDSRDDDRRREEERRRDEARRRNDDRRNGNDRRDSGPLAQESARRQQTKNEWRNIAIASGALGVYGLLKKDNTLTFAGAAGALYSLNRYEQDRKSQSATDRARAAYFSRDYFVRDGARYNRRTVVKSGQKNYQFFRAR